MRRRFVGGFQIDLLYSFGDVTHETAEKVSDHDVDEDDSREAVEGADRNVKEVVSTELLTVVALIDKIDVFGRRPSLARPVLQVGPPQTCTEFNFCCLGLGFFKPRAMPSMIQHSISTGDDESEGLSPKP